KQVLGNSTDLLYQLGRVACIVSLDNLKDTLRILQRRIVPERLTMTARRSSLGRLSITRGLTVFARAPINSFELPALLIVATSSRVIAREEACQVFSVPKVSTNDRRSVGVVLNILLEVTVVLNGVVDESA